MKPKRNVSAGILVYRRNGNKLEVLLAHPGGPFWVNRDQGAWTIPKGAIELDEDPFAAAKREFEEETGFRASGPFLPLGSVRQKAGKVIHAWACAGNFDTTTATSNSFAIEWPPGTGRTIEVPEIDRCEWFGAVEARIKLNSAQAAFLDRLEALLT
jgi:predicted NUDIX family NTP pyrophosphohydrolase